MTDYEAHQLPSGDILLRKTAQGGGCFVAVLVVPILLVQYGCEKINEWRKESRLATALEILEEVPVAIVIEEVSESINDEISKQANQVKPTRVTEWAQEKGYSTATHLCAAVGIKPLRGDPSPLALFHNQHDYTLHDRTVVPHYKAVYAFFEGNDSMNDCRRWLTENGYPAWSGKQPISLYGVTRDTLMEWDDWSYPGDSISLQRPESKSEVQVTCWYRHQGKLFVWSSRSRPDRPSFSDDTREEKLRANYWEALKSVKAVTPKSAELCRLQTKIERTTWD